MKRFVFLLIIAGLSSMMIISQGCKKKKFPEVTTQTVTEITKTTATTGGIVTSDGGTPVTARGVCYGVAPYPTINNFITENGSGTGSFTSSLEHLSFNTTYYLRAYATNETGTAYGESVVFYTTNSDFYIGMEYQGGIIFYLDFSGEHGLICTDTDQGKVFWSNESRLTGAVEVDLGTGQANTDKIVEVMKPLGINSAAQLCDDLEYKGYSDWFLPSKNELSAMYDNLVPLELGNFGWGTYWSSSESSLENAWCQNFRLGEHHDWNKNTNTYYVRAVRGF